jgi:hypothetical protein
MEASAMTILQANQAEAFCYRTGSADTELIGGSVLPLRLDQMLVDRSGSRHFRVKFRALRNDVVLYGFGVR